MTEPSYCTECGAEVTEGKFCMMCGAELMVSEEPEAPPPPEPGPKKKQEATARVTAQIGCFVLIGLGFALAVWLSGLSSTDTSAPRETTAEVGSDTGSAGMAFVMAKSFVEDSLKSPGTADFGSVWGGTYQMPDDCVTDLGDDKYRVAGWVDAENAFGATVRIDFVCELEYVGDDKWRLIDLQMDQR